MGVWPDEHIRGVIRTVVFRDGHSPHMIKDEAASLYPSLANYAACNGPEGAVSPGAAAAAAVAAVAQGKFLFSHFYIISHIKYEFRVLCTFIFYIDISKATSSLNPCFAFFYYFLISKQTHINFITARFLFDFYRVREKTKQFQNLRFYHSCI